MAGGAPQKTRARIKSREGKKIRHSGTANPLSFRGAPTIARACTTGGWLGAFKKRGGRGKGGFRTAAHALTGANKQARVQVGVLKKKGAGEG